MKNKCCILLYLDTPELDKNGKSLHYFGGYSRLENRNKYIKSFSDTGFTLTENLNEAYLFTDDVTCDKCKKLMVKKGAVTICCWEYDSTSELMQMYRLREMWSRDENKYRGYGHFVHPPMDFDGEIKESMNKPSCLNIVYPNKYWSCNDNIQPSLMNIDVKTWLEKHNK